MAARRFNADLVERAQRGDADALSDLMEKLQPMLRAFFVSRLGARSEVDDLVQNSLMRLHRGLPDLNDRSALKSFVMRAAIFELQDYYRGRYAPKERLYDPTMPPDGAEESESSFAGVDAERITSVLSDKARKILEMREYGYRYEEIAASLNTTEAAVKMQVKRAFEKMREHLEREP